MTTDPTPTDPTPTGPAPPDDTTTTDDPVPTDTATTETTTTDETSPDTATSDRPPGRRRAPLGRSVAPVVGLVAGLLVLGWLVTRAIGPDPTPDGRAAEDGAPAGSDLAPPDIDVLNDTEHGRPTSARPTAVVWWQQLSTLDLPVVSDLIDRGVGSDLADDDRDTASAVASDFVVADLTGVGRDEFPLARGEGDTAAPAAACCTDVEILAAGASSYPDEPPLVLALVVWSATPVNGIVQFDEWEASFVFLRPATGGYEVVDPSTVADWEAPPGLGLPSP